MRKLAQTCSPADADSLVLYQIAHLGDFLLALPAMRKLADHFHGKGGQVTLVCAESLQTVAERCKFFDAVLTLNETRWDHASLTERKRLAEPLLKRNAGTAVNFVPVGNMANWIFWSCAKRRFTRLWCNGDSWRERLRLAAWRGVDLSLDPPDNREHVLLRNMRLANRVLGLADPDAGAAVSADPLHWLCDETMVVPSDSLLIFPGAGDFRRAWPVARFAEVAEYLHQERPAWNILWCGSAGETGLCREGVELLAKKSIASRNCAGIWNIFQTAGMIRQAVMILGNDSAPMHIAGSFGTPALALVSGVTPGEFLPCRAYPAQEVIASTLPCSGCRGVCPKHSERTCFPCLEAITLLQAREAVKRLLAR